MVLSPSLESRQDASYAHRKHFFEQEKKLSFALVGLGVDIQSFSRARKSLLMFPNMLGSVRKETLLAITN